MQQAADGGHGLKAGGAFATAAKGVVTDFAAAVADGGAESGLEARGHGEGALVQIHVITAGRKDGHCIVFHLLAQAGIAADEAEHFQHGNISQLQLADFAGADAFLRGCCRSSFRDFRGFFAKAVFISCGNGGGDGSGLGIIDDKVDAAFTVRAYRAVQFNGLFAQIVNGVFHGGVFKRDGGDDDALELHQIGRGAVDVRDRCVVSAVGSGRDFHRDGAFPHLVHFRQHGAAGFVVSGCIVSHSAAVDRFLSAAGRHVVRVDGENLVEFGDGFVVVAEVIVTIGHVKEGVHLFHVFHVFGGERRIRANRVLHVFERLLGKLGAPGIELDGILQKLVGFVIAPHFDVFLSNGDAGVANMVGDSFLALVVDRRGRQHVVSGVVFVQGFLVLAFAVQVAAFRKELHGFLGLRFAAGHGCARCTGLVLVTARSGVGRSQGTGGSDGATITSLRKRAGGSNGHQRDQGTLRLIKWCVVHS